MPETDYPLWVKCVAIGLVATFVLTMMLFVGVILIPKSKKRRLEEEEDHRLSSIKANQDWAQRQKVDAFDELFGFDPRLLSQRRYQKEALLKLGLMTKAILRVAKFAQDYPASSEDYLGAYKTLSKEYTDAIQLIECFDPGFAKQIPHWTDLPRFVEQWLAEAGKRNRHERASVESD